MDIPSGLLGSVIGEGEKYFFTSDCPKGIPDHIHICVKRNNKILFFSTCSSRTDTAFALAEYKGWDMNTMPIITKNDVNKFKKEETYINCNHVYEFTELEFERFIKEGKIHRLEGIIDEQGMQLIANGIKLSTQIERRIKNLF